MQEIFFQLIDMSIVNNFVLFREHQRQFPNREGLQQPVKYNVTSFQEEVVRQLCGFPEYDRLPLHDLKRQTPHPTFRDVYDGSFTRIFQREEKLCGVLKHNKSVFKVNTYCSAPQCMKYMHLARDRGCFATFQSKAYHH